MWANLHYWAEMWRLARRARRPLDRLRVLWKRPGWRPDDLGGYAPPPPVDRASVRKYDVPLPAVAKAYVLAQFVLVNLGAVAFLEAAPRLGAWPKAAFGAGIVVSLVSLGGLLDRRSWAPPVEAARLAALACALGLPLRPGAAASGVLLLAAASLAWLRAAANAPTRRADRARVRAGVSP